MKNVEKSHFFVTESQKLIPWQNNRLHRQVDIELFRLTDREDGRLCCFLLILFFRSFFSYFTTYDKYVPTSGYFELFFKKSFLENGKSQLKSDFLDLFLSKSWLRVHLSDLGYLFPFLRKSVKNLFVKSVVENMCECPRMSNVSGEGAS